MLADRSVPGHAWLIPADPGDVVPRSSCSSASGCRSRAPRSASPRSRSASCWRSPRRPVDHARQRRRAPGRGQHQVEARPRSRTAAPSEQSRASRRGTDAGSSEARGAAELEVEPIHERGRGGRAGGVEFTVGTLVDGLGVMMLVVVTIISLLVHIYCTDYVRGDRRYTHYFAFLSLFTASMLMLVMSANTVQLILGWELVGLCSFVLIGHWWEEKPNSDAALKAFITNRVGDVGLLVGMIIAVLRAGEELQHPHDQRRWPTTASIEPPAAARGGAARSHRRSCRSPASSSCTPGCPTPWPARRRCRALIHAATMVVAGVFMVARLYPVFFHGLSIGDGDRQPARGHRRRHRHRRRRPRLRAERHQEGAGLLDVSASSATW